LSSRQVLGKIVESFEVDGNAIPLMLKNHSAGLSLPPPKDLRSDIK
jgi:hypothetical protein